MNNPLISIIIPLHNLGSKGDYCLKMCLDSILAQTFHDYEVLLMENGSTDDTVEVAKEYCNKDNRFKLHILDIIGIANARNEGIKRANGVYVSFIDGDDTISNDMLSSANDIISQHQNIDFISFPWSFYYINKKTSKPIMIYKDDAIKQPTNLLDYNVISTIWAKIIKKDTLINNNIFLDASIYGYDDFLFGNHLYFASKLYALSKNGVYYYTQNRTNQTTKTKLYSMTNGQVSLINKLSELYTQYGVYDENKNVLDNLFISLFIGSSFALTSVRKMNKRDIDKLIKNNYDKIISVNIDNIDCADWQKVWFKRFQKAVKHNMGYYFIKFMRLYRNLFIQPFRIKWYK